VGLPLTTFPYPLPQSTTPLPLSWGGAEIRAGAEPHKPPYFKPCLYRTSIWSPVGGNVCCNSAEIFGIRKLRITGLSYSVVCVILRLAVFVKYWCVTDVGRTDRHTPHTPTNSPHLPELAHWTDIRLAAWRSGNGVGRINEVTLRDGDVSGFDSQRRHFISVCNQPTRSTQPFILSRSIN